MTWGYTNPVAPDLGEVLKEINGKALVDIPDPADKTKTKMIRTAGQQLEASASSRTTARRPAATGCTSASTPRPATTRSAVRPPIRRASGCSTTGRSPGPPTAASCTTARPPTPRGRPGIRRGPGIVWNGEKWVGDVPDIKPDSPPGEYGAFIMNAEGVGRLFAPSLNDGPFPEHYEPSRPRSPNPLHPKVTSNPATKKFSSDKDVYGKASRTSRSCARRIA